MNYPNQFKFPFNLIGKLTMALHNVNIYQPILTVTNIVKIACKTVFAQLDDASAFAKQHESRNSPDFSGRRKEWQYTTSTKRQDDVLFFPLPILSLLKGRTVARRSHKPRNRSFTVVQPRPQGAFPGIGLPIRHFDWLIDLGNSCKKMAIWK